MQICVTVDVPVSIKTCDAHPGSVLTANRASRSSLNRAPGAQEDVLPLCAVPAPVGVTGLNV